MSGTQFLNYLGIPFSPQLGVLFRCWVGKHKIALHGHAIEEKSHQKSLGQGCKPQVPEGIY